MRHARFDENEIAGLVFQHLLATISEFMAHFSIDDVKDHFKVDMDVGVGDPARGIVAMLAEIFFVPTFFDDIPCL